MKNDRFRAIIYNQLGTHMWKVKRPTDPRGRYVADEVTDIYEENWRKRMLKARECGADTVCVDIGEMLQYPSHPEIWVKGAWSAEKMNEWVKWLKSIGLEPIPSLNFSTDHDVWLGEYSRMISTPEYYKVCRDLIKDAYEVFEKPEIMNFGMDEENIPAETRSLNLKDSIIIVRQGELYWRDNLFFIKEIEKLGARAWMWSDKIWWDKEGYLKNIPKSVLQGNWYYNYQFDLSKIKSKYYHDSLEAYLWLEEAGYDQVVGCSNIVGAETQKLKTKNFYNIPGSMRYALKNIAPERFKGIHVMPWFGVTPRGDRGFFEACDLLKEALDIRKQQGAAG